MSKAHVQCVHFSPCPVSCPCKVGNLCNKNYMHYHLCLCITITSYILIYPSEYGTKKGSHVTCLKLSFWNIPFSFTVSLQCPIFVKIRCTLNSDMVLVVVRISNSMSNSVNLLFYQPYQYIILSYHQFASFLNRKDWRNSIH